MKKPKISLIFKAFKRALKSSVSVLKVLSLKFGFYFLGLGFLILFLVSVFFPQHLTELKSQSFNLYSLFISSLLAFSHAFTIFIIPYYAYKETYKSPVPNFWDFISRTVYPIVIAHIKAILLILLFCLLLIVPGLYKKIRFSFINETVFFDRESSGSDLKKADQSTRSFFWPLVLFGSLSILLSTPFTYISDRLFSFMNLPDFLIASLKLVIVFYVTCFMILWKTFLYFEIKKFKGESISL